MVITRGKQSAILKSSAALSQTTLNTKLKSGVLAGTALSCCVAPGVADVEVSQQIDKRCSAFTLECFVVSISWFNALYGVSDNSFLFRAKLF